MAVNNIFGASSIDDLADNVLGGVDDFMLTVEKMQKRKVASNVQLVVQALKKIESDLQDRYDGVTTVLEKKAASIKDGKDGQNGVNGRDGKDGRPGRDGATGPRGANGADGRPGRDGEDGVSVTNAFIDFDGSLIINLSDGQALNVGEVVAPDLAEKIKVITNGGGTSQGVLDTLTSLQNQIDLISSALVYKGTWNASTNSPTLASGAGTANTFYIVSVAGSTTLNGISNWGVGDWATFNGTAWQRVEGGSSGNFTDLSVSGSATLSGGTANGVAYLNGSQVLTTGSALTFDGTNTLGVNSASATTIAIDSSGGNFFRGISFRASGAEFGFDRTNSSTGEYRHAIGPSAGWGGFHTYYVDGSEQMRLTSTGLGIGTSSPGHKLDVVGTGNFSGSLGRVIINSTVQNSFALQVSSTNGTSAQGVDIDSRSPTGVAGNQTAFRVRNNTNTWMLIDAFNGNVGIGTTTPNARLSVRTTGAQVDVSTSATDVSFEAIDRAATTNPVDLRFYARNGTFQWYNSSYAERMRLDSSGNLGIGTSSPNASAILDAQSTTKGVRMPNMTTTQKNAIASPAAGLMVFDTTLAKLCVYTGAAWQTITSI